MEWIWEWKEDLLMKSKLDYDSLTYSRWVDFLVLHSMLRGHKLSHNKPSIWFSDFTSLSLCVCVDISWETCKPWMRIISETLIFMCDWSERLCCFLRYNRLNFYFIFFSQKKNSLSTIFRITKVFLSLHFPIEKNCH